MEDIFNLCKNGDYSQVKLWIDHPENDILQGDEHGFSPLHWACKEGRLAVVELLLNHGALINATNMGDDTPLHLASSQGHLDVVKLLTHHRADVNAINEHGNTALHFACFWNYSDVAGELINRGAYPNIENRYGEIPLDKCKPHIADILRRKADILQIDLSHNIPFKDQTWLGTKQRSRDATLSRNSGIDINQLTFEKSYGSNYYDELVKGRWQNIPVVARFISYPQYSSPYTISPSPSSNNHHNQSPTGTNLYSLSPKKLNFNTNSYNNSNQSNTNKSNLAFLNKVSRNFQEEFPRLRVFSHPNILPVLGGTLTHVPREDLQILRHRLYNTKSTEKLHSLKNLSLHSGDNDFEDHHRSNHYDNSQCDKEQVCLIISQHIPLGSLFDVLHVRRPSPPVTRQHPGAPYIREPNELQQQPLDGIFSDKVFLHVALDICRGMAYLHSLNPGIPRFHLSSKNIMLDENLRAQINISDSKFSFQTKNILYNVGWMSPESLKKRRENLNIESSDMWSFAVILWEMSLKRIPFGNFGSTTYVGLKIALKNVRLPIHEITCPHMHKLVTIAMNENPAKRPTFDMVSPIVLKMIEKLAI